MKQSSLNVANMLGSVRSRLAVNRYEVDEEASHISFPARVVESREWSARLAGQLERVCPAGVYGLRSDGQLGADYPACFECGSCVALVGDGQLKWDYPRAGAGLQLKQG